VPSSLSNSQERYAKKNETEELRRAFELMDTKGDGKVDGEELSGLFARLGHKCKKNEIEDMIWEVDEDCDKCVNWEEFQAMYHR
jgi:calmodulin